MECTFKLIKLEEKNIAQYKSSVFGGSDMLKIFPEMLNEGIAVACYNNLWYIYLKKEKCFSFDLFFNDEELENFIVIKESPKKITLTRENFL